MQEEPPDVLMLSNYMWNEWLSLHFAELMKRVRPETLVVMGGPNLVLEEERQLAYMKAHPALDLYVLGEADFLAREIVREFDDCGGDLAELRKRDLPSCLQRAADGSVRRLEMWKREKAVEEIPSPWLTGILDEFLRRKTCSSLGDQSRLSFPMHLLCSRESVGTPRCTTSREERFVPRSTISLADKERVSVDGFLADR